VIVLGIMLRAWYPSLKDFITKKHLDLCGQVMLGTGMLVCFGYFCEAWMGWYSHSTYEWGTTVQRMFGPYGWSYWTLIFCNFVCIQPLWSRTVRRSNFWLFPADHLDHRDPGDAAEEGRRSGRARDHGRAAVTTRVPHVAT
jgi:molybdopterin-containing oxidoreductase family membrane subunit